MKNISHVSRVCTVVHVLTGGFEKRDQASYERKAGELRMPVLVGRKMQALLTLQIKCKLEYKAVYTWFRRNYLGISR